MRFGMAARQCMLILSHYKSAPVRPYSATMHISLMPNVVVLLFSLPYLVIVV
jgi:hypothetical protein